MSDGEVKGLDALQLALQQLPAQIEANIMRGALRAGAKPIVAKAEANLDASTAGSGELKGTVRISTRSKAGVVRAIIKAGGKKGWYAHFVERGTKPHWIKPKKAKSLFFAGLRREVVHHPGARPKPFLRPAADSEAQAALQAMGDYIRRRLSKQGIDVPDPDVEPDEA